MAAGVGGVQLVGGVATSLFWLSAITHNNSSLHFGKVYDSDSNPKIGRNNSLTFRLQLSPFRSCSKLGTEVWFLQADFSLQPFNEAKRLSSLIDCSSHSR